MRDRLAKASQNVRDSTCFHYYESHQQTKLHNCYTHVKGLGWPCWGILLIRSQALRPEIITQKLYYLQYCLANSLCILLASSYLLNLPISINLCISTRLWPSGKFSAHSSRSVCPWWQLCSFSLTLPTLSICLFSRLAIFCRAIGRKELFYSLTN